jgi:hypothetical protein
MEKDISLNSINRSFMNKLTMADSIVSIPSTISRMKKRKIVILGKMGAGKIISYMFNK